ncbi:MAG: TMEM175 family protein, partial [Nakamurella sp.]
MRTGRGFERLVNFTDAVIAIAVTLLVLPLVEIPGELEPNESIRDIFNEYGGEFGAFVLSFLVIWTFWAAHHHTIEYFRGYDFLLMRIHMVFLFTMISLPFSTQLLTGEHNDQAVPFYIGTLLVSSMMLVFISLRGRRKTDLLHTDRVEVQRWLRQPLSVYRPVVRAVALLVSLFFPGWGSWLLLLLLFDNVADRLVARIRHLPAPD